MEVHHALSTRRQGTPCVFMEGKLYANMCFMCMPRDMRYVDSNQEADEQGDFGEYSGLVVFQAVQSEKAKSGSHYS